MPILNPPNILPEAMRFLIRAVIASNGKLSSDELIDLVAPPGMAEALKDGANSPDDDRDSGNRKGLSTAGRTIAECSLAALKQLSLLTEHEETVSLGDVPLSWKKVEHVSPSEFAILLESSILSPTGKEVATDLISACALIHVADRPLEPFDGFEESSTRSFSAHQRTFLNSDNQQDWAVGNTERWQSLRRLGPYLGWLEPVDTNGGFGIIPNATVAIQRWLATVDSITLPASDFLDRLFARFPFMAPKFFPVGPSLPPGTIPGGVSLSLFGVAQNGAIKLENQSDASVVRLSIAPGHEVPVSHVRINSPKSGKRKRS